LHITVVPAGTTIVWVFGGGEGSLLLNEMQPASASGATAMRTTYASGRAKGLNLAMAISRSDGTVAGVGIRNAASAMGEYR